MGRVEMSRVEMSSVEMERLEHGIDQRGPQDLPFGPGQLDSSFGSVGDLVRPSDEVRPKRRPVD